MTKVIENDSVFIMHVAMTLPDGSAAESTRVNDKPAKVEMGNNSISPAFEAQLLGMKAGDTKKFTLEAKDAFGESNPDNIHYLDKNKFSADAPAEVGNIITFSQPGGVELPGMIREVTGTSVTVDFNHPLAGQAVTFDIEIVDIL